METRTIRSEDITIKITAKGNIPGPLFNEIQRIAKKAKKNKMEMEWHDFDEIEKEITQKHGDIDTPRIRLRAHRQSQGLTQKELSERSGVSQGRISEMEKGKLGIGIRQAKKLAGVLGLDFRKLVG